MVQQSALSRSRPSYQQDSEFKSLEVEGPEKPIRIAKEAAKHQVGWIVVLDSRQDTADATANVNGFEIEEWDLNQEMNEPEDY